MRHHTNHLVVVLMLSIGAAAPTQSPVRLADLATGTLTDSSEPREFTKLGGDWVFSARTLAHGRELWRTDGTPNGTFLLKDTAPGSPSGEVEHLARLSGNRVVFGAGARLWVTDGTTAGTVPLASVEVVAVPDQQVIGPTVVFVGKDAAAGEELWTTDGTPGGTSMIADLRPGFIGSAPRGLHQVSWSDTGTNLRVHTFFSASTPNFGRELWVYDGTSTQRLTDVNPGASNSLGDNQGNTELASYAPAAPNPFALGLTVWFAAFSPTTGRELYRYHVPFSGGGSPVVQLVRDINAGSSSSDPVRFITRSATLLFIANQPATGHELWKADALSNTAALEADLRPGPDSSFPDGFLLTPSLNPFTQPIWFTADDGVQGRALYMNTVFGTSFVVDIDVNAGLLSRPLEPLGSTQQWLYLAASRNDGEGVELWRTDGTPAGTSRVVETASGSTSGSPHELVVDLDVAGRALVLFGARGDGIGVEPWVVEENGGTSAPLGDLQPFVGVSSAPSGFAERPDGTNWFVASPDGVRRELYVTDGSPTGTAVLHERGIGTSGYQPQEIVFSDDGVGWFSGVTQDLPLVRALFRSDGTPGGLTYNPFVANPSYITPLASSVACAAQIPILGNELQIGSSIIDVRLGFESSFPQELARVGNLLFFSAIDASGDRELWRIDWKTRTGLLRVLDINPGGSSNPRSLIAYRNVLYFTADDGVHGRELWRSNGIGSGTFLVADVQPGAGDGIPGELLTPGGVLFFAGDDGVSGLEPWRSNGTAAGTARIADVRPGPMGSAPRDLVVVHTDRIAMVADDGVHGEEPWLVTVNSAVLRELVPGAPGSAPRSLTWSSRTLYCTADVPGSGRELWSLDGIDLLNPQQLGEIAPGAADGIAAGAALSFARRSLVFAADDGVDGTELWGLDTNGVARALPGRCAGELAEQYLRAFGPSLGQAVQIDGYGAPGTPGTFAVYLIDIPPPAPSPFGPDCYLQLNPATMFAFAAVPTTGQFNAVLPLPNINGVPGATVRVQCAIIPGLGAFGIDLTNALEVRIGF